MMENQTPYPRKSFVTRLSTSFAILLLVGAVGFFLLNSEQKTIVSDLIRNGTPTNIVDTIKKEINNPGALVAKIESDRSNLTASGVFLFTNQERKNNNLTTLTLSQKLSVVAGKRMNDMFARGYFEHVSPKGESASTVADDVLYEYITIGENIAMGNFADDKTLVDAWMNSPGHRANILHTRYTEIGIAVGKALYNGRSTWIAVQIFARPLSLCTQAQGTLKNAIDLRTKELDLLQQQIVLKEKELNQLKEEGRVTDYNQEVQVYNILAKEVNEKIVTLKESIEIYNTQVRDFNACISK